MKKRQYVHMLVSSMFLIVAIWLPLALGSPLTVKVISSNNEPSNEISNDPTTWDQIYDTPTPEEQQRIDKFDPSRLNYTALRISLDEWLLQVGDASKFSRRQGRFLGESYMPSFLTNLGRMLDIDQVVKEIETSIMSSVSCNACRGAMGLLQHYLKTGKAKHEIIHAASNLCTSFKVETPRVCFGIINLMANEILYVAANVYMTPDEVCAFVIGDVCGTPYNPLHDWKVTFPPVPKPPVPPPSLHQPNQPTLKVLHLSDTHYDPDYQEGSNAECGKPLCCRATSGRPATSKAAAGYWGDYRKCDTPRRTIYNMLQHITYIHPDIDYILWTGDLPPHDIWNQTKESNIHVLQETVTQLLQYFPKTPIFPALGNHESAPVNSFPPSYVPEYFGVGWLYEELNRQWQTWLPEDVSPTILKGGFYSVLVKPKLRIISINTNFCNNKNWWLLVNSTDPADELQWLIYELQGAELRNEKVHLIGHIPPGHNDCLKVWSHNYYSIINRYESTVSAQYFAHTHFDEFEVFYDEKNVTRATSIAYVAPSVTTYERLNPGYRIYTVDATNQQVIDHETWVMNLEEANRVGIPRWFKLYSARRAYAMHSLHPQEWDSLIYQMAENKDLFERYHRFYWKASVAREKCDRDCKKRMLCDLKSGRSHDRLATCAKVKETVEAKERTGWGGWIFSGLTVT